MTNGSNKYDLEKEIRFGEDITRLCKSIKLQFTQNR